MAELRVNDTTFRVKAWIAGVLTNLTYVALPTVSLVAVAFASLPGSPSQGMLAAVTDSNTATWGAVIAAGGANKVLAYYNGTNWTVAGV